MLKLIKLNNYRLRIEDRYLLSPSSLRLKVVYYCSFTALVAILSLWGAKLSPFDPTSAHAQRTPREKSQSQVA